MKDLLRLLDLSSEQITKILDTADVLKAETKLGKKHNFPTGKVLAMIFEKNSTRTRVSFETGIYQLGGHGIFLVAGAEDDPALRLNFHQLFCQRQPTHAAHVDVQEGDINRIAAGIRKGGGAGGKRRRLIDIGRLRYGFFQRFEHRNLVVYNDGFHALSSFGMLMVALVP